MESCPSLTLSTIRNRFGENQLLMLGGTNERDISSAVCCHE
jgi:hypothetical protein